MYHFRAGCTNAVVYVLVAIFSHVAVVGGFARGSWASLVIAQLVVRRVHRMARAVPGEDGIRRILVHRVCRVRGGRGPSRVEEIRLVTSKPMHAGSKTENVIERTVLEHQHNDVVDRGHPVIPLSAMK